ncbi:phage tail protein [Brachyspira sp. SAP_772]|uniref:phage tail protein n=1 Tax=Brachyspira sp. SAP_772 TaxID=2608385 RepID=UPI0012F52062|nr:phage tail protein [Brachyspira sp. SAP_772]
MFLNENNLQAPFQYKISENSFKLEKINNSLQLSEDNEQIKVFKGEKLFCVDIGYGINGALEEMEFILDGVRVYPLLLDDINCIRELEEVEENKIYLIKNDVNFKSIIFLSVTHLNKQFEYSITAYNTTLSSWMFDYIAKKINTLDTDYPIKNYYGKTDYKINDIIKHNGYLYRVNKDFLSDDSDYYLVSNCSIITPFKSLETGSSYNAGEILEYENNFFVVSENFIYSEENDIYNFIKPLIEIINWFDGIKKLYKNQIIVNNGLFYLVLDYVEKPIWNNLIRDNKIEILSKASNIFYDDSNTSFGNNTNNIQLAIEKLKIDVENKIPTGGSNLANNILYDNSKTNLGCKTGEYDFPKFKNTIPETINLLLTDGTNDYPASIIKQEDGSYSFNASLNNIESFYGTKAISLVIKSIETCIESIEILNIINIFWKVLSGDEWTVNDGDIFIEGISDDLQFEFIQKSLIISKADLSDFERKPYNITLNIKNRQLKNIDTYFLGIGNYSSTNFLSYLNLQNNNGAVKLVGAIKGSGDAIGAFTASYSFLSTLANYFNLSSSYINTSEITSNTGKAVKYYFTQNALNINAVDLIIAYQDGSQINYEDVFTLNLTPNKNYSVNPIYKNVTNIQELGESLALRYMIPPYYVQYPDVEGNFNPNEEPSVWFKKMYNITTTWQIMFNTESVYFRTEGDLANVGRVNGIQGDAGRNATGSFFIRGLIAVSDGYGVLYGIDNTNNWSSAVTSTTTAKGGIAIDLSRAYTTANEFRVKNRLIIIYKLLTIDGKTVGDIIGA